MEQVFCEYHAKAYDSLVSAFPKWERAYGSLHWRNFLARVIALPETGSWVKEVAEAELREAMD